MWRESAEPEATVGSSYFYHSIGPGGPEERKRILNSVSRNSVSQLTLIRQCGRLFLSNAIFFLGRTLCFGGRTFDLATELRSPGAGTSGFQGPNFELPAGSPVVRDRRGRTRSSRQRNHKFAEEIVSSRIRGRTLRFLCRTYDFFVPNAGFLLRTYDPFVTNFGFHSAP